MLQGPARRTGWHFPSDPCEVWAVRPTASLVANRQSRWLDGGWPLKGTCSPPDKNGNRHPEALFFRDNYSNCTFPELSNSGESPRQSRGVA
jgi:hypothetical protein